MAPPKGRGKQSRQSKKRSGNANDGSGSVKGTAKKQKARVTRQSVKKGPVAAHPKQVQAPPTRSNKKTLESLFDDSSTDESLLDSEDKENDTNNNAGGEGVESDAGQGGIEDQQIVSRMSPISTSQYAILHVNSVSLNLLFCLSLEGPR